MATKSAPLETFLSTVSPSGSPPSEVSKTDFDPAEGARAVILIILAKDSPLDTEALQRRSELNPDLYQHTVRELVAQGLIQSSNDRDYSLTPAGVKAAEQQRSRLLSLW